MNLAMRITKRKPSTVGEILIEEFMEPLNLSQTELANAMGVPRRLINELCRDRRSITVQTALLLAQIFGNTAEFWLNLQKRIDLWDAMNSPELKKRLSKIKPLSKVA